MVIWPRASLHERQGPDRAARATARLQSTDDDQRMALSPRPVAPGPAQHVVQARQILDADLSGAEDSKVGGIAGARADVEAVRVAADADDVPLLDEEPGSVAARCGDPPIRFRVRLPPSCPGGTDVPPTKTI